MFWYFTSSWFVLASDCPEDVSFSCVGGDVCLSMYSRCDGYFDCDDGSDELNCGERCSSLQAVPLMVVVYIFESLYFLECNFDEVRCADTICIHENQWCDDVIDCIDGSDEAPQCFLGKFFQCVCKHLERVIFYFN